MHPSPRPRRSRCAQHLCAAFAVLAAACAGGCWATIPAGPDRAALRAESPTAIQVNWPPRDLDKARAALDSGARTVRRPRSVIIIDHAHDLAHPRADDAPCADALAAVNGAPADKPPAVGHPPDYVVAHAGLYGQGLIRVIDAVTIDFTATDLTEGMKVEAKKRTVDSMIRFVSFSTLRDRPATVSDLMPAIRTRAAQVTRAVVAERRNRPADADTGRGTDILWDGLAMRLLRPPGDAPPPRGLIVHLGGSNSGRIERPFIDLLVRRGWAVLSMPYVGLHGGNATRFVVRPSDRSTPPELVEVVEPPSVEGFLTPLNISSAGIPIPGTVEVLDSPAALGQRIAEVLDDRAAEAAYAVEAALEYLATNEPALVAGPHVLLGCSAGAMAAPAVAARLPGRLAAAVLVGGGANLLEIGLRTSLRPARPSIGWDPAIDQDTQERQAIGAYAGASQLDPERAASALKGIPLLMLHARFDAIVPARNGERLWEALGRPERRDYYGGHLGLFVLLEGQAEAVDGWLKAQVGPAREARGGPGDAGEL